MTPTQFDELKDLVISLWGSTPKWARHLDAYKAMSAFKGVPFDAARIVVEELALSESQYAPSIPEVMGKASRMGGGSGFDPGSCLHDGVWCVVERLVDGSELQVCGVCRLEERTVSRPVEVL